MRSGRKGKGLAESGFEDGDDAMWRCRFGVWGSNVVSMAQFHYRLLAFAISKNMEAFRLRNLCSHPSSQKQNPYDLITQRP